MDTYSRQRYPRVSDVHGITAYILAVPTYTKYHRMEISLEAWRSALRMHSHCKAVEEGCRIELIRGFRGSFFFCPFRICTFPFFYLCWFCNLCSVPYVFLILLRFGIFRVWWFGVWQFGILLQWFFLVRCYFFLCTWYVFWYLVAFKFVILLYEVYHFRYFGSSLFSYCISVLWYSARIFSVFCVFVLRVVFGVLLFCYFVPWYCISVYLYEYVFLYLVFGISVLALSLLVFLYVSSSVRARTRYVRTVVMVSWIRGDGRRVLWGVHPELSQNAV